jgi:hypothetical protein
VYEKIFNLILKSGFIPKEWVLGMIKPLYKNKGDKHDVDNYRGITLLSCIGKLFSMLINNRLNKFLEDKGSIGSEQAGFRKSFSTLDHIFTLKYLIEFYLQKKNCIAPSLTTVRHLIVWIELIYG